MYCADPSVQYRQLDVVGAYLTAFMKREVFIRMPKGFGIPGEEDKVFLVLRALYGGADSGRLFFDQIVDDHIQMGFKTIPNEHCFLVLEGPNNTFIKCVFHVDDFAIAFRGDSLWDYYLKHLKVRYTVKVNELTHFLGLRILRNESDGSFRIDLQSNIERMARAFQLDK